MGDPQNQNQLVWRWHFLRINLLFPLTIIDKETSDILYEVPKAISLGYGNSGGDGSAIVNAASHGKQRD